MKHHTEIECDLIEAKVSEIVNTIADAVRLTLVRQKEVGKDLKCICGEGKLFHAEITLYK